MIPISFIQYLTRNDKKKLVSSFEKKTKYLLKKGTYSSFGDAAYS